MERTQFLEAGAGPLWKRRPGLLFVRLLALVLFSALLLSLMVSTGCTIFATRPVQEMSYTLAAIKAAKEVQADVYTPELFRLSNEWFFRAKNEYKYKNFKLAKEYADKARHLAEQAEFEAIRSGAIRSEGADTPGGGADTATLPPGNGSTKAQAIPTPTGTPVEVYDQRKAEDDARRQPSAPTTPSGSSGGTPPRP